MMYWHGWPVVRAVKAKAGELDPDMVEESTKRDGESAEMVARF